MLACYGANQRRGRALPRRDQPARLRISVTGWASVPFQRALGTWRQASRIAVGEAGGGGARWWGTRGCRGSVWKRSFWASARAGPWVGEGHQGVPARNSETASAQSWLRSRVAATGSRVVVVTGQKRRAPLA